MIRRSQIEETFKRREAAALERHPAKSEQDLAAAKACADSDEHAHWCPLFTGGKAARVRDGRTEDRSLWQPRFILVYPER